MMIKRLSIAVIAILSANFGFAQEHNHIKCGADIQLQRQLEDPEVRARYEAFQEAARRYAQNPNNAVSRNEQGIRIIPTVFHILHAGGNENITRAKVEKQMEVLNEDFRRLNVDTVNMPERFRGDTEYTSFVFTDDAIEAFVGDSAYAKLYNRYDEEYVFHFNNGSGALSDSLQDDFENVIEINVSASADTAELASSFANSVSLQNGLSAQYVRDTTVFQAPNFTVDGTEVDSLNYSSQRTFETVLSDLAPSFTVDGNEVDTLFYTADRTYETSFIDAAPNFLVDGIVTDTLFYTTEHTYTTSWNGSDVDTTFSDTLTVELFDDVQSPFTPTDTLQVFPAEITYDIYDGSGAVSGVGTFVFEDTLVLSYSILVDTLYTDTLTVELFESELTPFEATDTLDVFNADVMFATFDENGDTLSLNGFIATDTLILDYFALVDTVFSDTLMVELFEDAQDPFEPTDTLYVFNTDLDYVVFSSNGDTISVETFVADGNLELNYTEVVLIGGDHKVNVWTDGYGYTDDVLLASLWSLTSNIDQQGSYIPADSRIEFRLATKDPLGNCSDGIVRVFTSKTNDANNGTGFKAESYWNAYSYLNVWVVDNIDFDTGQNGITLGYAQFPGTGFLSTDGITVRADNIDERYLGGRTATHEVGHWLDLRHIWGDATCGSDDVLDTPTHNGPNFGVCGNSPSENPPGQGGSSQYHTAPYNANFCSPDQPDGEMFMNYMDYSSDNCMNMFTLGQKARMDFILEGDGTEQGYRQFLVSQENLEATGVADPYAPSDCAPISDFYFDQGSDFATQKMICVDEEVDFEESAYNAEVDDFSWTFEGGNPAISTSSNPNNVQYANPGVYDVTLEVSNASGSNVKVSEDMIIVSSLTADYRNDWGYVDSYWNEDDFLADYFVFNQDGSENKWEWFYGPDGGATGWESVRMFNLDNRLAEIDELISPSYDLSTVSNPTLQFRYSGASIDNTPDDELRIYVSDDCGETWGSPREILSGFELTNAGLVPGSYVPNSESAWNDIEVNLGTSNANKPNIRIKFRWLSGGRSNNFYIDDLTLSGSPIGMDDLERQIDLSIAPNPTNDITAVTMRLHEAAKVRMEVIDILGKEVTPVLTRDMTNGAHRFDIDMSSFTTGVYYMRIFVGNDMIVKKVVKN